MNNNNKSKNGQALPELEYCATKKEGCVAWRYVIAFFGFFAMTNSYAMRSHMSVTLVAMVETTAKNITLECPTDDSNTTSSSDNNGEFNWDEQMQGIVSGSFYWGYLLPQILGGRLAELYSAKLVILVGGSLGTLATLLGPVAARSSLAFFVVTRVLCGLGLSVFQPCLHAIISKWCPPSERSVFSSIVYSGNQFGVVLSMPITGVLCEYASDGGWPWPFYTFGILGAVWLVLWAIFVYNNPDDHPWISNQEKLRIHQSLSTTSGKQKVPPVPWKSIFKTKAVWALIIAHFGYNWGFYTLLTQIPTFMSNVLGFDIAANGFLSSLPYVVMMVVGYTSSFAADLVLRKGLTRVVVIRKSFNTIAMYASALSLLVITFLKCQTMGIYALLILAVASYGGTYAGFQINHVDLSPNFAGTLQGITNTAACIPGIISPYITGLITEGSQTHASWSIVFYISMAIMTSFGTVYLIFGSATLQSWNDISSDSDNDESPEEDYKKGSMLTIDTLVKEIP